MTGSVKSLLKDQVSSVRGGKRQGRPTPSMVFGRRDRRTELPLNTGELRERRFPREDPAFVSDMSRCICPPDVHMEHLASRIFYVSWAPNRDRSRLEIEMWESSVHKWHS